MAQLLSSRSLLACSPARLLRAGFLELDLAPICLRARPHGHDWIMGPALSSGHGSINALDG